MKKKPAQTSDVGKPVLLSGGNPQIAKGDGPAVVESYVAAMPDWKGTIGRELHSLILKTVPGVRMAVRWNTPFYGIEGRGWFMAYHCVTKGVKVAFFRGTSLDQVPPVASKQCEVRYVLLNKERPIDRKLFASWLAQASALPGYETF